MVALLTRVHHKKLQSLLPAYYHHRRARTELSINALLIRVVGHDHRYESESVTLALVTQGMPLPPCSRVEWWKEISCRGRFS